MAISVMKKISLIAAKSDADLLLKKLTWAESVEISESPESVDPPEDYSYRITYAESIKKKMVDSKALLAQYRDAPKGLFPKKSEYESDLFDEPDAMIARAMMLSDDAYLNDSDIKSAKDEVNRIDEKIKRLTPYVNFGLDLEETESEMAKVIFGSLPIKADIELVGNRISETFGYFVIESLGEDESKNVNKKYVCVTLLKEGETEVLNILESEGFVKADLSFAKGTPVDAVSDLIIQKKNAERRLSALENERKELSRESGVFELAIDLLDTKIERTKAKSKAAFSDYTVMITGYIPEKDVEKTYEAISEIAYYSEIEDVSEDDPNVPIKLENNKWAKNFEPVLEMYSLPKYGSFDPTFIMSLFYFVIFGFMLADVVYGLIVSLVCIFAVRKFGFEGSLKKMVTMFAICGFACAGAGIIFGSYLGDLIQQVYKSLTGNEFPVSLGINLLDTNGIFIFIGISLVIGAIQIITGMGINMYVMIKRHDLFGAIFDIGSWYVVFAGAGCLFLFGKTVGICVIAIGVIMKVSTGGRKKKGIFGKITGGLLSLYDIVGMLSDLISYTRIMALGLSSAVIAMVVNTLATLAVGPSIAGAIVGIIVMIPIVLIGHTFNIGMNLLGCFVHSGRLQYIEFFGKFYEDGGKKFEPLSPKTSFTKITKIQ